MKIYRHPPSNGLIETLLIVQAARYPFWHFPVLDADLTERRWCLLWGEKGIKRKTNRQFWPIKQRWVLLNRSLTILLMPHSNWIFDGSSKIVLLLHVTYGLILYKDWWSSGGLSSLNKLLCNCCYTPWPSSRTFLCLVLLCTAHSN